MENGESEYNFNGSKRILMLAKVDRIPQKYHDVDFYLILYIFQSCQKTFKLSVIWNGYTFMFLNVPIVGVIKEGCSELFSKYI